MTGAPVEQRTLGQLELPPLEDPVERVIVPVKRRLKPKHLFGEGPVIRVLAARDFKIKYKQSLLGPIWLVFQPAALLVGFIVAFKGLGNVKTSGVPYTVFALAGLTAWSYFQAAMIIGTSSLITNANFVRYTPCPRPAFPAATLVASLPTFAVTAAGTFVASAASGRLSLHVLLLPLALVWLLLLTGGVVAITSSLTVRYRDIIQALPFIIQVGVFFVPVGYSLPGLSHTFRILVELNPLTGLIESMRWMLISDYHPTIGPIALSVCTTTLLVVWGWRYFARRETTMADEI